MVYDHKTQTFINDTVYHEKMNIELDEFGVYKNGKNDLFAIVIIFKQMLQKERFKEFIKEINAAFDIFSNSVNTITVEKLMERMGFPENYKEIIDL